jgi:hypothetical protein
MSPCRRVRVLFVCVVDPPRSWPFCSDLTRPSWKYMCVATVTVARWRRGDRGSLAGVSCVLPVLNAVPCIGMLIAVEVALNAAPGVRSGRCRTRPPTTRPAETVFVHHFSSRGGLVPRRWQKWSTRLAVPRDVVVGLHFAPRRTTGPKPLNTSPRGPNT